MQTARAPLECPIAMMEQTGEVILIDGDCVFCARSARFVMSRDKRKRYRFAPLQSETGGRLLAEAGVEAPPLSTMVLITGDRAFLRSSAALRIAAGLGGLWRLAGAFLLIPPFLRDAVYNFIAARRHRLFPGQEACEILSEQDRKRFLEL